MSKQSNQDKLITIFGGSGFVGRHVVRALAKRLYRIRVAVRRPDLAGHLQPLGRVGQIHAVQANVRYPASIEAAVRDADAVINLVGILFERGAQRFAAVHTAAARPLLLHCNKGESRSPTLALLHLALQRKTLPHVSFAEAGAAFQAIYPAYRPGQGIQQFVSGHWNQLIALATPPP